MKVNKIRMRETLVSYAFLAPILLFFTVFVLAPMIMGFVTSFFNYSMTSFKFVGLENYSRMFADKVFVKSLINTVIIVIGSVPIVVLFSLFVASQTYHQNAIARSFYRNKAVMIMDEPSSALDPMAEYQLNQAIHQIAEDKTVIFISHRLSTTRDADCIYMMENGRIIEHGTHEELLNSGGKYSKMWNVQAGRYI